MELTPHGIRLVVETDRPELRAAVADACRGWEGEADENDTILHLKLVCDDGVGGGGDPEISVDGHHIRLSGAGVEARADAVTGRAECAVVSGYLSEGALREQVLDPLILFLLTRNGRTPIHASGFLAGDVAILLAGPSGAGKSCLALAAHEAGFPILSDDTVYLQLHPEFRIWGVPRPVHLFPEDAPAGSGNALRLRNGRLKRPVPVGAAARATTAGSAILCVLDSGTEASLQRIGQEEALRGLGGLEPGFDLLRAEIEAALEALTRNGAWRLTLSRDPAEAIRLLAENLPRLRSAAVP